MCSAADGQVFIPSSATRETILNPLIVPQGLYPALRETFYSLAFISFLLLIFILFLERFEKRNWCKNLCPSAPYLAFLAVSRCSEDYRGSLFLIAVPAKTSVLPASTRKFFRKTTVFSV
jgi:hypothetical protein